MPDQQQPTADQLTSFNQFLGQLRPQNRDRLFDALKAAGITTVFIEFDGSGDEGQINEIAAYCGAEDIPLPETKLEFLSLHSPSHAEPFALTLQEALEGFAYDTLSELRGGWQDNDGACGTFTFNSVTRTAGLDFNARYTASEHFTYDL